MRRIPAPMTITPLMLMAVPSGCLRASEMLMVGISVPLPTKTMGALLMEVSTPPLWAVFILKVDTVLALGALIFFKVKVPSKPPLSSKPLRVTRPADTSVLALPNTPPVPTSLEEPLKLQPEGMARVARERVSSVVALKVNSRSTLAPGSTRAGLTVTAPLPSAGITRSLR